MKEIQYPIGGFAPGNYWNKCRTCNIRFAGDKRANQCEPCAMKEGKINEFSTEKEVVKIIRNYIKKVLTMKEEDKLSLKYWERNAFVKLIDGKRSASLYEEHKETYDKLVALEAKIEFCGQLIEFSLTYLDKFRFKAKKSELEAECQQLGKDLNLI